MNLSPASNFPIDLEIYPICEGKAVKHISDFSRSPAPVVPSSRQAFRASAPVLGRHYILVFSVHLSVFLTSAIFHKHLERFSSDFQNIHSDSRLNWLHYGGLTAGSTFLAICYLTVWSAKTLYRPSLKEVVMTIYHIWLIVRILCDFRIRVKYSIF